MKTTIATIAAVLGMFAAVEAPRLGLFPEDDPTCGDTCVQCERVIDGTGQSVCDLDIWWWNVGADGGFDGCCLDPPNCPDIDCNFSGTLVAFNTSINPVEITINGPGTQKVCANVPLNSSCSKLFAPPTNPSIVAECDMAPYVLIERETGGESTCQVLVYFRCGEDPCE